MSADDYLESILRKYAVNPSPAVDAANSLTPLLREWAGRSLLDIQFSGSYAKGTAISLGTDIDLFLSLDSNQTVKDLYWSLFHYCEKTLQRPQVAGGPHLASHTTPLPTEGGFIVLRRHHDCGGRKQIPLACGLRNDKGWVPTTRFG